MARKRKVTWIPITAGILSIISGVFTILVGIGNIIKVEFASRLLFQWRTEIADIGTGAIVLGIIAIVGGIFAIRRKIWGLALAGAICALFPPGVLGILAISFLAISKREFS